MSDKVCISKERFIDLINKENFLDLLEGCGVDNWEGFEFAQDDYQEITELNDVTEDDMSDSMYKDFNTERANKLATAHWEYVQAVLTKHGSSTEMEEVAGFHYITAFVHGYKHAIEDVTTNPGVVVDE